MLRPPLIRITSYQGTAGGNNTYSYVYGNPLYWIWALDLCGFDAWDLLMFVPVGGSAILAGRLAFRAGNLSYRAWQARRKAKIFCCFEGSTLVATPTGYEEISSLEVGDLVYARDEKTGETEAKPISHFFVEHHDDDVRLVTVESNDGDTVITTSDDHPFCRQVRLKKT